MGNSWEASFRFTTNMMGESGDKEYHTQAYILSWFFPKLSA
jgi:hypothetical protein